MGWTCRYSYFCEKFRVQIHFRSRRKVEETRNCDFCINLNITKFSRKVSTQTFQHDNSWVYIISDIIIFISMLTLQLANDSIYSFFTNYSRIKLESLILNVFEKLQLLFPIWWVFSETSVPRQNVLRSQNTR